MNSTDEQWMDLFEQVKRLLKKHECEARAEGDPPAVDITAEENRVSTTQWVLKDDERLEDNGEPDGQTNEINLLRVECADCQARLIGGWDFRSIDDGSVRNIDAPTLGDAWKALESEYSDPIHAAQDWAAMEA
ncbi:MAG: hypothetical protein JRN45_00620 [Nitrososphaerota archaeon]|nr:hypothetical protein [Nitrososphaerota archaeon]